MVHLIQPLCSSRVTLEHRIASRWLWNITQKKTFCLILSPCSPELLIKMLSDNQDGRLPFVTCLISSYETINFAVISSSSPEGKTIKVTSTTLLFLPSNSGLKSLEHAGRNPPVPRPRLNYLDFFDLLMLPDN